MGKVFDARHLFDKKIGKFRKAYEKLGFGEAFNKAARSFEKVIPFLEKFKLNYEVLLHDPEEEEGHIHIRIYEGIDDSSVGAKSWTLANLLIHQNGTIVYTSKDDEVSEFRKEWADRGDEGDGVAVGLFVMVTIPLMLSVQANPAERAAKSAAREFIKLAAQATEQKNRKSALRAWLLFVQTYNRLSGDETEGFLSEYADEIKKVTKYIKEKNPIITKRGKKVYANDKILGEVPVEELEENFAFYHEKRGNFIFPKDFFLLNMTDSLQSTKEIAESAKTGQSSKGKQLMLFIPGTLNRRSNFPTIWRKKQYHPGIIGAMQGHVIGDTIEIDFMSVRPSYRRNKVNSLMLEFIKNYFPGKEVKYIDLTEEGKKFAEAQKSANPILDLPEEHFNNNQLDGEFLKLTKPKR